MDKQEAKAILAVQLVNYRGRSYTELQKLLKSQDTFELTGDSGARYQLEFYAVWDVNPGGNLRVCGCIDDGGVRAFFPLTADFIAAPS